MLLARFQRRANLNKLPSRNCRSLCLSYILLWVNWRRGRKAWVVGAGNLGGRAGPSPYARSQRLAESVCHLLPSWFLGSSWHLSDSSRLTSSPSQTPKLFPSSEASSAPSSSKAVINTSLGTLPEVRTCSLFPGRQRRWSWWPGRKKSWNKQLWLPVFICQVSSFLNHDGMTQWDHVADREGCVIQWKVAECSMTKWMHTELKNKAC